MKKIVSPLVVLSLIGMFGLALIPQPVGAMTGSGTEGDPYMIYDVDDLQDMNLNLTAYYKLANDIDASNTSTWNWNVDRGFYDGFEPIGTPSTPFTGTFNGDGYPIYSLFIDRPSEDCVGLFGKVSGGSIDGAAVIGNISGSEAVGGLAGYCLVSNVSNSYSGSIVNGESYVGGLIGYNGGFVENSYSEGSVSGDYWVGGLIGDNRAGVVACASAASVNVGLADGGGLIGINSGGVSKSYAVGNVTGLGWLGGLIGENEDGTVSNSYARGDVIGFDPLYRPETLIYIGGLIGDCEWGAVSNSYSTGNVTGNNYIGGLVGDNFEGHGLVTSCFWDVETSGMETSDGGTGKNTIEMTISSTFTDAGWDFTTIWNIDPDVNDGYPYLGGGMIIFPSSFTQVVWFQPNTIIEGTTLPNRTGEVDGEFHWGSNPAGVSVVLTGFYSDYAPANVTLPGDIVTPPQDMIGPTGNPGMTRDVGTLVSNPFYPLVKAFSDNTSIPVQLWWIILASLIVLIVMVVTYWKLPHLMITALAGGSLSAFFYAMGIYPFWVPLIFAVMALAIIIGERSPTV